MPKLLHVHQLGKYANICATYELTGLNHVTMSTVYKQCRMMTMQVNDDNATAQLHRLSGSLGKISQRSVYWVGINL